MCWWLFIPLIATSVGLTASQNTTLEPFDLVVLEPDSEINLTCISMEATEFNFYKDDLEIQQPSELDFFTIEYNSDSALNGGEYRCEANNISSDLTSVFFAPKIITPNDVKLHISMETIEVQLNCTAVGYPTPTIEWLHNEEMWSIEEYYYDDQRIVKSVLTIGPEPGDYVCVASINGTGNDTYQANRTTTIIVSPKINITDLQQTTVNRSTTVTFECSADGGPNNMFYWVMDDTQSVNTTDLPASLDNVVGMGETLTLNSVIGSSGGTYTCVAFNDAGFDTASVVLYVSPEILEDPLDTFAENDDTVTLTCVADSFPAPQYQWQLMNDTDFLNILEETNCTLIINPVEYSDFGAYRCIVTAQYHEEILSEVAYITVSPIASVDVIPMNISSYHGDTSTFNCSAEGGPINTFRWVQGIVMTDGLDTSQLPLNVSMILDSLLYVRSDNNELNVTVGTGPMSAQMQGGEYTCFVINEAGFDNSTVTLYISPQIVQDPMDQYVQDGDTVTLTCVGDSYPPPEYQWERWDMTNNSYQDIPGETNNTLVFTSIEHEDYGRYRCVVTAPIIDEYVMSEYALITVSPNNSIEVDPSPSTTVNNGDDVVVFNCSAEGGPNNMFAWIKTDDLTNINTELAAEEDSTTPIDIDYFLESIFDVMLVNDSMLSLSSVSGSMDGGSYTCLVINEAGVGRQETILYVHPMITVQPMDTNAENGDRVELTCIADSFPAPEYQWELLNETNMFNFSAIDFATQSTLVFDPVEYNDAGTYRCIVTTPNINEEIISNEAVLTVSPNSSVVITPSAITVDNGSSVTFVCSAQGNEDNYYFTWLLTNDTDILTDTLLEPPININNIFTRLDGRIIVNGTELTIDSVSATRDGGSYSCFVFNVAGSDTGIGELFVNPVIITPPSDILAEQGDVVNLTCIADSFDRPQYEWQFMNRTTKQFETIEGETDTELLFSLIAHEDYGMYQCVVFAEVIAENEMTMITVNITSEPALITVSPKNSISVSPQQTTVNRSTTVTFECSADGGPNNMFYWVMDDTQSVNTTNLPASLDNVVGTGETLTLNSVIGSSGGTYTCVAFNDAGFDTASVMLYVSPEILEDPMDSFAENDDTVTLTCVADSFPAPQYQWQLMNDTDFEDIYSETNSTLVFSPVDFSNFGTYRCVVTVLVINEIIISQEAVLTISPLGSHTATPMYQTGSRGDSSTFDCSAEGGPINTFRWVQGIVMTDGLDTSQSPLNVSMILDSLLYVQSDNDELNVTVGTGPMSAQMQGGEYTCFVINEAGFDNSTVTLYISPQIVQDPMDQYVQDGDTVTLTCVGDSYPPPEYQWERWNMTTDSYQDIPGETNNTLVFTSIEHEDYEKYRCVVTAPMINETVISESALITAHSVPDPPMNITATEVSSRIITLTWKAVNDTSITYNVTYTTPLFDGQVEVSLKTQNNILTVQSLHPGVQYSFTVTASNEVGESEKSNPFLITTLEEEPDGFPQNLNATTISSTAIEVSWDEVFVNETNGVVTEYNVTGVPDESFADVVNMVVDSSVMNVVFNELEEFVVYIFTVSASTEIGYGPSSPEAFTRTSEAVPSAAPQSLNITHIGARSANLTWTSVSPEDANGNLSYSITIVAVDYKNTLQERNVLSSNLEQCLNATGVKPAYNFQVQGNQLVLRMDNNTLAPFVNYSFTVAGHTSIGIGPSSRPLNFTTMEDVPTVPGQVKLSNTSSTSLELTWSSPKCNNGKTLTGYRVYYKPLPSPIPIGEIGDESETTNISSDLNVFHFTGLTPNSPYQVVICALTFSGCGENATVNQTTTEGAPPPITNITVTQVTTDIIAVSWLSPSNRNGAFISVIHYNATQNFIYQERRQTYSGRKFLNGSNTRITQTHNITDIHPYSEIEVTLFAFNKQFGENLSSPPDGVALLTDPIESTEVLDLSLTSLTESEILVYWNIPLYPNGPISYFNVCYTIVISSTCESVEGYASSYILRNLTYMESYAITVQPVTVFNGMYLIGKLSETKKITINSTIIDPNMVLTFNGSAIVNLPRYQLFSGTVIFYGIVIDSRETCTTSTNYAASYSNLKPSSLSNDGSYYIAGGWGDVSHIPRTFTAGNNASTTAWRLGQNETYTNPQLRSGVTYCIILIVYLKSNLENQPVVHYLNLGSTTIKLPAEEPGESNNLVMLYIIISSIVAAVIIMLLLTGVVSLYAKKKYRTKRMRSYTLSGVGLVVMSSSQTAEEKEESDIIAEIGLADDEISLKCHDNAISTSDFPAHVSMMHSKDMFSNEYSKIEPNHYPTTVSSCDLTNSVKNRYVNVVAYDHSRVKLQDSGDNGSDYINANFIDGYESPNAYIASQGPMSHTSCDFWRMVWEQETTVIVMLTKLEENGKIKCHMYWPKVKSAIEFGQVTVYFQQEVHQLHYTIRTFVLKKEGDERIVTQFHFTAWPDFGVPEHSAPLLKFIRKVEAANQSPNSGPMIIHCSAGVGRTGTFITIASQLQRIKDVATVEVFNFVQRMRYNRCLMVQTETQYIFIHDTLLEFINCGETEVSVKEFKKTMRKLCAKIFTDDTSNDTLLLEFERVQQTILEFPSKCIGAMDFNRQKNRFKNVIPYDETRYKLNEIAGIDGSDYINANCVEGYRKRKAFIATQGPLEWTVEDFWRMVWESKSSTIVMLAKQMEESKELCHCYWPKDDVSEIHGRFEISIHSVKNVSGSDYVLREIKMIDTEDKESSCQLIKHFQYTGWPTNSVPGSATELLDIREQVEKWQRNTDDQPIIVHCSGGCGRTGTFIAILILIDQLKSEGVIDVFQTVRTLRLQRVGLIRSVDQYKFLYKVILEFLESFDIYSNFD